MQNKIDNLIAKELSGNATSAESAELSAWIAESEKNAAYFEEARNIWKVSANLRLPESPANVDGAWEEFRILADRPVSIREKLFRPVYLKAAAAIFIVVSLFVTLRLFVSSEEQPIVLAEAAGDYADTFVTLQVPSPAKSDSITTSEPPAGTLKKSRRARRKTMIAVSSEDSAMVFTLPDNSKVYLNKYSKLIYPEKFTARDREVFLSGEAYFETSGNDGNFYVYCHDIRTRMIGNALNVKGLRDGVVEISAISGEMQISYRNDPSGKVVYVKQGEQVVYDKASHAVTKNKVSRKDKWWKRGSFRTMIREFFNRIVHPKEYRNTGK